MLNLSQENIIEKRIKEITFVRYHRKVKSSKTIAVYSCPVCGSTELITVATAAGLTGISRSVFYNWVKKNKVQAIRLANGQLRICCQSLFEQIASSGINQQTKKQ